MRNNDELLFFFRCVIENSQSEVIGDDANALNHLELSGPVYWMQSNRLAYDFVGSIDRKLPGLIITLALPKINTTVVNAFDAASIFLHPESAHVRRYMLHDTFLSQSFADLL